MFQAWTWYRHGMEHQPKWHPEQSSVAEMGRRYAEGQSCQEIGDALGFSPHRIYYQLKKAGVPLRGPEGAKRPKTCRVCGAGFASASSNALFCSKVCQYGEADCEWCGKTFTKRAPISETARKNGNRQNVFCSKPCEHRGRRVPDDRRLTSDGYVSVRLPDDWPWHGHRYNGTMLEHRMLMILSLGRPLNEGESVHHINGVRSDNRPENLQLRQGHHGKGVVMRCLSCGSHDVGAVSLGGGV